jgi:hypothetical protein
LLIGLVWFGFCFVASILWWVCSFWKQGRSV